LGDVICKWFHCFYLDSYIDSVGCNFYHPFGEKRSCVDVVADHSVYLSEEEEVLLVHGVIFDGAEESLLSFLDFLSKSFGGFG